MVTMASSGSLDPFIDSYVGRDGQFSKASIIWEVGWQLGRNLAGSRLAKKFSAVTRLVVGILYLLITLIK
jgi:hypothetical protein